MIAFRSTKRDVFIAHWFPAFSFLISCSFRKILLLTVNRHLLAIPRFRFNTYGRRAFSVAGPMAWNSLSDFIRDPVSSTDCFRRLFKTYTCSHDTSASSALGVLNDHALYKSTHSFTYSLIPTMPPWLCTCNNTW